MFPNFYGNRAVNQALWQAVTSGRVPQTILLAGPQGVGKATLARRLAAALLGNAEKIERDDLSLPENSAYLREREKWPAERRNEDPLIFASHPDFVTFAPDGPLRQISIQQMRLLKELAQYKPLRGNCRVFLIDELDRANEQAANSLLKTLEEPPEHLLLVATAENVYELLPTIRSRAVIFHLSPLSEEEMAAFVRARGLSHPERRIALAQGRPGLAASLDLEAYDRQREAMLTLLEAAAGAAPFAAWVQQSESAAVRQEKLEILLIVVYGLLRDLLVLSRDGAGTLPVRNDDIRPRLQALAGRVNFRWLERAVSRVDEIASLVRRNIQKTLALDALIAGLRP
ncbi:MAG: AAA family ATPase [Bryobacterales bacterium]|nr:AAA family ATPase [Bryobacteraceae bacterium]MDW8129952.1 AAA family ATPase [Bryobacterales bacterium]